ncbi:class I SAM-dependent methyltransferase [Haloprofundus halophilus]|uniref:class I SAM-dependent methyltransferase n=1 Tax=Haloprofundus halophilus TaxID=2283527 RepID=UPI00130040BC|nr:class I SAM-dependent methyltransferase [Haloprofundus halophilus]
MREFIEDNRKHWEELADLHPETDYYEVEEFLNGESTLDPIELEELGPVEGKSLLHLQCHFGLDTLSWARRGADVTGVDISTRAVEAARELADKTGLGNQARFVQSDVYEIADGSPIETEEFDIVYTSFGVLFWLPDLAEWADVVAQFVRKGGTFYLAEHHPFTNTLSEDSTGENLQARYPYFRERISYDATETGSYAGIEPEELEHGPTHGWSHSLGEIVSALCESGLQLEFLHEYPWSTFEAVDAMERRENGRYVLPELEHDLPFVFSLRASR